MKIRVAHKILNAGWVNRDGRHNKGQLNRAMARLQRWIGVQCPRLPDGRYKWLL